MGIKNLPSLMKSLKGLSPLADEIVQRTVSDFKSRGPAQVRKAVGQVYNITNKELKGDLDPEISKKKVGSIRLGGRTVGNLALVYTGRALTPRHFKMNPLDTYSHAGNARKKIVKATIIKGRRIALGSNVFTAPGKAGKTKGTGQFLPFQRTSAPRLPIDVVRTIGVPQMIQLKDGSPNPRTAPRIDYFLWDMLDKRLANHIKQAQGKVGKMKG
jgi:hypothetical protein